MKIILDSSKNIEDVEFYMVLLKLHKSYLFLLSDQKDLGIGTVSLSAPASIDGLNATSASYDIFGIKNKLLNNVLGKRLSSELKVPVLILVFLKSKIQEEEIIKPLLEFINEKLVKITDNS